MPVIVRRVSELIGQTPLFELAVSTETGSRVFLKLETMNPTGAAKIRMARAMILEAERRELLRPGGHIIESTSGNTGLGLAVVARERGYRFTAVVDHHACKSKLNAMRSMGTELVFVGDGDDEGLSTNAREELAEKLAAEQGPTAYFPAQHHNSANAIGYYALAAELAADLGKIDVLIAAVGTGGALFGTARGLRELGRTPRLVGVEPEGSIAFGGPAHDYWQSGTGTPLGADPGLHVDEDLHLIDAQDRVKVSDADAFATTRVLAAELGLMIGGSSGSSVYTALTRLNTYPDHSVVVVVINDDGEKYLDTVFDDEWMSDRDLLDREREAAVLAVLRACTPPGRPDPREIEVLRDLHFALPDTFALENGLSGSELRDYVDEQLPQAKLIRLLELADMPAHRIGEILAQGDEDAVLRALDKHRKQLADRAAVLADLLADLRGTRDPHDTHTILVPPAGPESAAAPRPDRALAE